MTKLRLAWKVVRKDLTWFGPARTGYDLFIRGLNRCVHCKLILAITLEEAQAIPLDADSAFGWRFFNEAELHELAQNPDNDIREQFLHVALSRGDRCFGALDHGVLASYGWYATMPTEVEGAVLQFPPEYVYAYKAFTHPNHRGKRLHAIGMNQALRHYLRRGYRGFVSCVETNNFASRRSFARLGFQCRGWAAILKLREHRFIHTSAGCRRAGLVFAHPDSLPGGKQPRSTTKPRSLDEVVDEAPFSAPQGVTPAA
jgi:GNAT superfamily N-acetyltransferase